MNLLKKPFLNENEVQDLIPQGTPFVMVDKMHYYSEDKVISGFTIPKENILDSEINNRLKNNNVLKFY